jgi:ferrochelatase
MRYGEPSIASGLDELKARGCDRILIFPMYPQYAGSTTGSLMDAVAAKVQGWRWVPPMRVVPPYYAHSAYLDALAETVRADFAAHGMPERLLLSFHGLPQAQVAAGDPYAGHCECTARGLAEQLDLDEGQWQQAYQSRFGPAEWLTPATDTTLEEWGGEGLGAVAVACPGFPADCLETLEEIALGGRESFEAAGGGQFRYIPALNDQPVWLDAMMELAEEQLVGWLPGA